MRLIEAFENSESVVVVLGVEDGAFLDVNPAFVNQLGYPRDEVLGRIPFDIGLWPDTEFRSRCWSLLRAQRRIVDLPTKAVCADGMTRDGHLSVEYVQDRGRPALLCLLQFDEQTGSASPKPSETLYRSLYLTASEGIYRTLPGGGFVDVNPALARMLGYESPSQLLAELGTNASRIYADRASAAEGYRELQGGGRIERIRNPVYRRDGSIIWVSENARAICDAQGNVLFYEGSMIDITAQREAEQALKQSQALYQVLVENSRDGVFLVQRGKVVFANTAMASMLGYTQAEINGMDYMALVEPADRDAQLQRKSSRESGNRDLQMFEMQMLRKDGGRVLCEVRADAVEYRGDIASTGTLRDVTEDRRQQWAIVEAERRYRELFEDSPAGLFRTSLDGAIMEVNPVLADMLGYESPEALKADKKDMLQVYADPTERLQLVERAVRDGSFSHHETQIHTRSGELKWVSASVRLIRDEQGRPAHFTGSVLDIDSRYRMQQALLRSEVKYRALVEHSQVGVFISQRGSYLYVNRFYADMLGRSEEQLRTLPFLDLVAPDFREAARIRIERRVAGHSEPEDYESCFLHSNGSRVFVTISVAPVEIDGDLHMIGTVRDITRQREAESRLRFHATHDPLTGLPNRMVFNRRLGEAIGRASVEPHPSYAVLFLDLDGFKWVNDSLGHVAGDRMLVEIARRLENALVSEVLIARYGGDEFTLLPDGPCDPVRAVEIAKRVLRLFEQPFDLGSQQVFSSASVGIVLGQPEYESPDQILRDADTAMYRAKAAGKSGYVVFDEAMHSEARRRLQLETDFRLAFERSEFLLHYQPIVSLSTRELVGAEALVRWQHPQRGMLGPEHFLAVAEETGLLADMDNWVLHQAGKQLAAWRRRYPASTRLLMNVNVDERQMASPEIIDEVFRLLQSEGLPPSQLRLEVTETAFRAGRGQAEKQLTALKALGVGLVVDDFGTGYSSLESFAASPFDALKVDQIFVRDIETNPRHRAIVRTIIGFARDLGLSLTAEGIETEGQRQLLLDMGCHFGQGFLFSRPLSTTDFEQQLQSVVPTH